MAEDHKSKVDYATHCLNFVTGCEGPSGTPCPWCYARGMVNHDWSGKPPYIESPPHILHEPIRDANGHKVPYPFGFEPTVHLYRLAEPFRPKEGQVRCFLSNMGDLFGRSIPAEHIRSALDFAAKRPGYSFLCLTKVPERYAEFTPLPPNVWAGVTVTSEGDKRRLLAVSRATGGKNVWVSYEPALGPFPLEVMSLTRWLVIGALTKWPTKPDPEDVRRWVAEATRAAKA